MYGFETAITCFLHATHTNTYEHIIYTFKSMASIQCNIQLVAVLLLLSLFSNESNKSTMARIHGFFEGTCTQRTALFFFFTLIR